MYTKKAFTCLIMTGVLVFAFGTMAKASDIAFYVGMFQPGSYDDETMAFDVETMMQETAGMFNDVQSFDDENLDAFGAWAEANIGDGDLDIIWLNGQIPSTLYPTFNEEEDGSGRREMARRRKHVHQRSRLVRLGNPRKWGKREETPMSPQVSY